MPQVVRFKILGFVEAGKSIPGIPVRVLKGPFSPCGASQRLNPLTWAIRYLIPFQISAHDRTGSLGRSDIGAANSESPLNGSSSLPPFRIRFPASAKYRI